MQIRFNLAFTNRFLSLIMYLDNGARCTETSVPITHISCFIIIIIIIIIFRQVKRNDKTEHRFGVYHFELDNGVMTTAKRCSVLSFLFTCLCITKPLLIRIIIIISISIIVTYYDDDYDDGYCYYYYYYYYY